MPPRIPAFIDISVVLADPATPAGRTPAGATLAEAATAAELRGKIYLYGAPELITPLEPFEDDNFMQEMVNTLNYEPPLARYGVALDKVAAWRPFVDSRVIVTAQEVFVTGTDSIADLADPSTVSRGSFHVNIGVLTTEASDDYTRERNPYRTVTFAQRVSKGGKSSVDSDGTKTRLEEWDNNPATPYLWRNGLDYFAHIRAARGQEAPTLISALTS